ncbi:MAG: hypothetical protein ACREM1_05840 [Longimicrobiales bacterium]
MNSARVAAIIAVASLVTYSSPLGAQRAGDSDWNWADPPASTVELSRDPARQEETRLEPAIAGGLSALLPGAGQFYNGQTTKGILMLQGFAASIVLAVLAGSGQEDVLCPNPEGMGPFAVCPVRVFSPNAGFWIGLGAATGVYAWSILDAIAVANRSSGPAREDRRGADLELAPRLADGTLALAVGIRLRP